MSDDAKNKLKNDPKFSIFREVIKEVVGEELDARKKAADEEKKKKGEESIFDSIFG